MISSGLGGSSCHYKSLLWSDAEVIWVGEWEVQLLEDGAGFFAGGGDAGDLLTCGGHAVKLDGFEFISFFFMMVFIMLGGLFTSIDSMPDWAKMVARFNPVSYFVEVIRMIVLKGSGFEDIKEQFVKMFGFAVVFNALAVWNYRKRS